MNKTLTHAAMMLSALMVIFAAGVCITRTSDPESFSYAHESFQIGTKMVVILFFAVLCLLSESGSRFFETCVMLLAVESCKVATKFFDTSFMQIVPSLVFLLTILATFVFSIIGYCRLAGMFSLKSQAGWASLAVCFAPLVITAAELLCRTAFSKDISVYTLSIFTSIIYAGLRIWFFFAVASNKCLAGK